MGWARGGVPFFSHIGLIRGSLSLGALLGKRVRESECVCVCVCVRERERESLSHEVILGERARERYRKR